MAIWSRNKIWGASTFNTDVDVADNTNNASQVPATSFLGLKISSSVDAESRNRSKWFTSVIGQLLRAVLHKEEDRATGANIGVSGTGNESTQTVYTTPEQLPEVDKTTNDFSTPAKSDSNGALTTTNDLFNVSTVTTDRKNKKFVIKFSDAGVLFFKARTWLQSEIESIATSISTTVSTTIVNAAISAIPSRVAPVAPAPITGGVTTFSNSFAQLAGMTYTVPSDGKYLINFRGTMNLATAGATTAIGQVSLYNNTATAEYDSAYSGIGSAVADLGGNLNVSLTTIQTLVSGQVIIIRGKNYTGHTSGTNVTCNNTILTIQEIK